MGRKLQAIIRRAGGILGIALAAAAVPTAAGAAEDPEAGDLRDIRVGTEVEALPGEGYTGFRCGAGGGDPGREIAGWAAFQTCPPNPDGLHEVAFGYDEDANPWAAVSDRFEGTTVAGHPVVPTLLIDDAGVVRGLRIVTDPGDRMYLKKKAYLLYVRVMGRYGRDGWRCDEREPEAGYRPVGGMYIDRRCEKRWKDRDLILETQLFRAPGEEGRAFTGATQLEIMQASSG